MSSSIVLTVNAADKAASILQEENNPNLNWRLYIVGGGCSGFKYEFTLDEQIMPDDVIIEQFSSDKKTKVKLLIDSISCRYLNNAKIDYEQGIQGEQFIIRNPNAKTTCGCGSSFSVDDD